MKKTLVNTMITTGASLSIIAIFWLIIGDEDLPIKYIFQTIGANMVINFGFLLRNKFEIRNVILEFIVDVSFVIMVLILFCVIFKWYLLVPVWFLVAMAIGIHTFMILTTVVKINKDTKEINELLEKRKEK